MRKPYANNKDADQSFANSVENAASYEGLHYLKIGKSKEEYARKIINNCCSVRIENSVTRDNYSASRGSLVMPNIYPHYVIFNPHLTAILILIICYMLELSVNHVLRIDPMYGLRRSLSTD